MTDFTDFYGQPITDYSWLFEQNKKEDKDAMARYNAAMLSVLSTQTNPRISPKDFYLSEYSSLVGTTTSNQDEYIGYKSSEMSGYDLQSRIKRILDATKVGLPSATQMVGEQPETAVPQAMTEVQRLQERSAQIGVTQQQLAAIQPTQEAVISNTGAISTLTAINAYRDSKDPTIKAKIQRDYYDYLQLQTLNELGHDPDLFTASMIDDWAREFIPGKYTYALARYGGLLDLAAFKKLTPEQQMVRSSEIAQKLIEANADPLTILDTLDRFRPDAPLLSGMVATSIFLPLDLIGLGSALKYGPRAARLVDKIRILRKMNAPGVASNLGSNVAAGQLSGAVLAGDEAMSLAVGIDKTTAGMNASPFKFSELDSTVTDGISAETLRYIEEERKVLNYKLNAGVNSDTLLSGGFFRPEERAAYEATVLSRLPSTAEILERTPFGVQVRVVTKNNDAFKTQEELVAAENSYDAWRDAYQQASDELDRFYEDAATGQFDIDAGWVNRLEAQKARAKQEMDTAYSKLTKGIEPDKVQENFVFYNRDDFSGTFNGVLESGTLMPKLLSPDTVLRNIDNLVVSERTEIYAKQSQLHNLYKDMVREVYATVSNKQAANVDAVLLHGDDKGIRFTASQLETGLDIPGTGTVRLNKKQMAAYFKARDLFDSMHGVHNITKYRRFKFENYKRTNILIDNGEETLTPRKMYVKSAVVTSTAKDGSTIVRMPSAKLILDARGNTPAKMVKFDDAFKGEVSNLVKNNKAWVVQLEKPVRIGDEMLNYAVIPYNRLKELDLDIIPYRTGYVPRIYDAVPYVVRQERKVRFDGTDTKNLYVTERFFMNRKEGEAWAASKTAEDGVVRIVDADYNWREKDPTYLEEVNDSVRTGLYETERGEKIKFGSAGEEAARLSAFGAMDRYMDNLAWSTPLNEWRQSVIQRYFNTVNEYLEIPNDINSPYKSGIDAKTQAAIENVRSYIQEQLSITSEGERLFARTAKGIADNIENSLFWKTVGKAFPSLPDKAKLKLLYGADNVDAYGWLRNVAFRAYLGFFSIPQLFVQASNMVTVASLHPTNAFSVGRRIMALRAVASLETTNPQYEKIVRIAAKSALMKYEDFEPIVKAWNRSGLYYSTRISADVAAASRNMSPGGDFSRVARTIDSALLFPYQEGELWARMYGFLDSATRYRKANPGQDITNIDTVNEIVNETFRVAFNYTQANKAWWQKGAISIPTQFLQAPVKFYEAMLAPLNGKYKGQFSVSERVRLALGQAALFGTAGIAAGSLMRDQIAAWLTTEGENGALYPDLDENKLMLLTGGVTDFLFSTLFSAITDTDTKIAVAQRVSLAGGLDLTISNLFAENANFAKILLGAFGGVLIQKTIPVMEDIIRVHGTQAAAGQLSYDDVPNIASKLATITSTWSNIHRARMWENLNAITTREGNPILPIDPQEEDRGLILAKSLGFQSYEEIAAFRLLAYNKKNDPEKEIRDAVKTAERLVLEYVNDYHKTEDGKTEFSVLIEQVRSSLPDEESRIKFDQEYAKMLLEGTSLAAKEYRKFIERRLKYDPTTMAPPPADMSVIEQKVSEELLAQ